MKKHRLLILTFLLSSLATFAQNTTANDGNWAKTKVSLLKTPEAEYMIRTGDIDNLGFGFPEGFDPFCGRSTQPHEYPWAPKPADPDGTDRIMLPSSFNPEKEIPCGGDGYSGSFGNQNTKPAAIVLSLDILKGATIKNAYLQLFIDDFQSPFMCSRFQMTLNGKRFVEAEKLFNAVDQTGPIGKLITFTIPEEFYPLLAQPTLKIYIDDPITGAADGYALDFVKLLVNRNLAAVCKGHIFGKVVDVDTEEAIPGAKVEDADKRFAMTDEEGQFEMRDAPAGLTVLTASAKGYANGTGVADVAKDELTSDLVIRLKKTEKKATFEGLDIQEGETRIINNILFDQGSAELKPASKSELDKIITFLQENPAAEIELSGHTSSEGDAALNRSLSYRRVKSCKDYILSKNIATERIVTVGYGPDRPVASNASESGRIQNRRVEMRVLKL